MNLGGVTSFFRSIASDLVEKRLWPIAALLAAALMGVLGFVVLHGGSASAPPPPAVASAPPAGALPVAVTPAPANPNQAVSETTSGSAYQRQTGAHDPFMPFVAAAVKAATTGPGSVAVSPGVKPATSTGAAPGGVKPTGSTTAPTPSVPTTPGTPSTPTPTPAPATPPAQLNYHVEVRFGTVPTDAGQPAPALTDYPDLARLSALPDPKSPIVVFLGVRADGKTVTFTLLHEAILRGGGVCRPDPLKCQLLDLRVGQKEQIDYLTPSLGVVRYELDLVNVTSQTAASPGAAARFNLRVSVAGRKLLRHGMPTAMGGLSYSLRRGVIVPSSTASPAVIRSANRPVRPVASVSLPNAGLGVAGGAGSGAAASNPPPAPSPAYAPPLSNAGPPVVQPGWLEALLRVL